MEILLEFLEGVIISETALIQNSRNRMSVFADNRSTEGEII